MIALQKGCTAMRGVGVVRAQPSRFTALRVSAFREDDPRRGAQRVANKGARTAQKNVRKLQRGIEDKDLDITQDRDGNQRAYGALAAGYGLTAISIAAVPNTVAEFLFQGGYGTTHDFLHEPLFRLLALGLSAAAVSNYVQKIATEEDILDDVVHRRLNGSLSFFAAAQIFLQGLAFTPLAAAYLGVAGSDLVSPPAAAAFGGVAALQWWVAGRNYAKYSPEGANPGAILKSYLTDALSTFGGVSNGALPLGYAALTATYLLAGFSYIFLPGATLDAIFGGSKSPEDLLTWQLVGAGVATVLGPMAYTLKEAAANSELGDRRYKLLNIALLTASLGHIAILGPLRGTAEAGPALLLLLGAWVGSGLVSAVGLGNRE